MIENARIKKTMLGIDGDHHMLTAYIWLEFGRGSQAFGGFEFGSSDKPVSFTAGLEFIRRVLAVVGVDSWEDLRGKYVRADREQGRLIAIGNILKEDWFRPEVHLKGMWAEAPAAGEKPEEESC